MPLVSLREIRLSVAGRPVLDGVDLQIERGEHVVLVGPGESAKRSLLALVDGRRQADGGRVEMEAGLRVASTARTPDFSPDTCLFDATLGEQPDLLTLRQKISRAREEGESAESRLADLEHRYALAGGPEQERRVTRALELVGFDASSFEQPVHLLTGSERQRLVLVRVLISGADLLVLEDPTRALDIEATEFLESFLSGFKGSLLVLSADRAFIERFCTRLVGVERDGGLRSYPADFQKYLQLRVEAAGEDAEASKPMPHRELEHSGKVVFQVRKLLLRPGGQDLLADVDFAIERGERVGIIGPVGSGKSSLLKVLADVQAPEGGHVQRGFNALVGYLDQEVHGLSTGRRVRQELTAAAGGLDEERLARLASALGFAEDTLAAKVEDLSLAEQSLLANARLILGEHTVLLLDEPTQHLDCGSSELLADALQDYPGTLVVVSHNRHFLDRVANRILSIEGRSLVDVEGRYSELRAKRAIMADVPRQPELGVLAENAGGSAPAPARAAKAPAGPKAKDLERKIEELIARMADPSMALDWEGLEALSEEKKQLQEKLQRLQSQAKH